VTAKPSVIQALSAVMEDVQAVGKGDRNTQQGYMFRGVDAVVNAVGPALRQHGVVVVPVGSRYEAEEYVTQKGTRMRGVTMTVRFRFYGPAGDHIDAQVCGESSDSGDKAVPKAHSVAYRTLLLEALCIPTDEPDPDAESHERSADLPDAVKPEGTVKPENPAPKASKAQKDKLNVLVGKLREGGYLETKHLYAKLGVPVVDGTDEAGVLHWGPLREQLTKAQASVLIDGLSKLEETVSKPRFEAPETVQETLA
jgi:hypothetical protein